MSIVGPIAMVRALRYAPVTSSKNRPFPGRAGKFSGEFEGAVTHVTNRRNPVPLQHLFDRMPVKLLNGTKQEERIAGPIGLQVPQQELRNDLVGTGEIQHPHLGEIDDGN